MGLFDSRKEHKTIKLAKKLQEQADKEWELEMNRRKQQEINDQAIALELQAQLEEEQRATNTSNSTTTLYPVSVSAAGTSNNTTTTSTTITVSTPPPLPLKPREYGSTNRLSTNQNNSLASLPVTPVTIKPLYSLNSSSSNLTKNDKNKNPPKSYIKPTSSYQPNLQISIATPGPSHSSVFSDPTPKITPVSIPKDQNLYKHDFYGTQNGMSSPVVMQPVKPKTNEAPFRLSMPEPTQTPTSFSPIKAEPIILPLSQPKPFIPQTSYPNQHYSSGSNNSNQSYPPPQNSDNYPSMSNSNTHTYVSNSTNSNYYSSNHNNTNNYQAPSNQNYPPSHNGYPPLNTNTSEDAKSSGTYLLPKLNHNNSTPYPPSHNQTYLSSANLGYPPLTTSNNTAVQSQTPPVTNDPLAFNSYSTHNTAHLYNQSAPKLYETQSAPSIVQTQPLMATQIKPSPNNPYLKHITPTNPYFQSKTEYSSSTLSLKPDEKHQEQTDPESDDESVEDYSDMFARRHDDAVDPFADNLSVEVPVTSGATSATIQNATEQTEKPKMVTTLQPTLEILDPTLVVREEEKVVVNRLHQYEEKESQEIEVIQPYRNSAVYPVQTPLVEQPSVYRAQTPLVEQPSVYRAQTPLVEQSATYSAQTPFFEQAKVYPTNNVKAGAPIMSTTNPFNQSTASLKPVPASDYGYFRESDPTNKQLPELPASTSDEDRHITVASINPGQKAWIRIHPTDTGKLLADRIGAVASYRTRRVTKITTKTGRSIPLDNTPLFDDWKEIINFQNGELWKIEWAPVEAYVDIITESKEFMKQLKASFKS